MSRHLTSDGTRLHDHNGRINAGDLQPGDTYTRHAPHGPVTHTVTGAPYADKTEAPRGPVAVLRIPIQRYDGTYTQDLHDTLSPDPEENLL